MNLLDKITGYFSAATGHAGNTTVGDLLGAVPFSLTERDTGRKWIDGKAIFQLVVLVPGGDNASLVNVATLANAIDTLIAGTWAGFATVAFRADRGNTTSGFQIINATGEITVFHGGLDFSGETLNVIMEYTKV